MEVRLISLGIVAVTELFLVFSSIFSTLPLGDESIAIVDTFQVRKSSRVGTREAGMRLKRDYMSPFDIYYNYSRLLSPSLSISSLRNILSMTNLNECIWPTLITF